ncbi:hypothetical protein D3871_19845 [Noviherbaspirillum saxi]|uniref:Uncharacterized protein n=1 Tax=Noviherbaspirillum saxi TaxID=2320863 RepID=A0A3A3FPM1_9BURK|nr:hypothetical protein D3871_19845 [Noviherbaspirillum saxi]
MASVRKRSGIPSALSSNENGARSGAGRALSLADIAEAAYWVASQPSPRYVNHIDMLSTDLPFIPTPRELR